MDVSDLRVLAAVTEGDLDVSISISDHGATISVTIVSNDLDLRHVYRTPEEVHAYLTGVLDGRQKEGRSCIKHQ